MNVDEQFCVPRVDLEKMIECKKPRRKLKKIIGIISENSKLGSK